MNDSLKIGRNDHPPCSISRNSRGWAIARHALPAVAALWAILSAGSIAPAADRPKPRDKPLSPQESLATLKTPDDLAVDLVLAEPTIAQPLFLDFDERGRLWVMEYRQYPAPAGLKMLSHDSVWRSVYDKVPQPPPHHFPGLDRISIHEDADGDGVYESHKVFVDGLNIATSFARGRGGVWVLNPPYLLFYADKNNDDIPDGDPEVHLEGFGIEDTHSVVNSLRFGPDGLLYAAQGSTVSGQVRRYGTHDKPIRSLGQLIWRYDPKTRKYEIFAEGGGNAFGLEIDAKGRLFSGHNGGNTRGFHYIQGGYYQKGFGKHGPLSNPFALGYFPAMKHHDSPRFSHTFLFDESPGLPERYRGKLFGVEPLLAHVVLSDVQVAGSTFRTRDLGFPIVASDPWFRPVDIKLGPDGGLYVADWYDRQINHWKNYQGEIDRSNGRVYRLRAKHAKPAAPLDPTQKTPRQWIDLLSSENRTIRQIALRLLGDRADESLNPELRTRLKKAAGQTALETLWALNLGGGLDEAAAEESLKHADPFVRLWTVRLVCDDGRVSDSLAHRIALLAAIEPNIEARVQIACSARRLPASQALPILKNLLDRDEDANDPFLPLSIWWGIEAQVASDIDRVLSLFADRTIWKRSIVRQTIAERLMRRLAGELRQSDLALCSRLLKLAPEPEDAKRLIDGFEASLSGRSLPELPDDLASALSRNAGSSPVIGVRRGDAGAIASALRTILDESADRALRARLIAAFGEVKHVEAIGPLLKLVRASSDDELRASALTALPLYDDSRIAETLLSILPDLADDLRLDALSALSTRGSWSLALLRAIDSKKIDAKLVPVEVVYKLQRQGDPRVAALLRTWFPHVRQSTSAESAREIERLSRVVRGGLGVPKSGKKLFETKCARCHTLFALGGRVGPDLTTYQRSDAETMLLHIVNPNAEIREGFSNQIVSTKDGRMLSGILVDQNPTLVALRGDDGRDVIIRRSEIDEIRPSPASLMPEGLLKDLSDQQVRDLFAYLRSSQPNID